MSDKIKVAIRVRPLIEREKLENLPERWVTKENQIYQVDPNTEKIKGDVYTFDHIFGATESNSLVFDTIVKPIIDASMQGFNGTVFAYGQTSSGKTYTMSGSQNCLGIIPLAINYIFHSIENTPGREFLLRVSYMEIYNEKVNDLLDITKKNLKIQEDCNGQVIVTDVEERVCKNSTEVLEEKMKGDKNRRIGETNMNERSSRSHTIFRIILESTSTDDEGGAVKVSHLNLVDLAGSERSGQSGATGNRFKEGCHINMSLTTLGIVINQLSDGQEGHFINFRDSKLTRLLQSSLGGNAKTVIVCAVTPAAEEQTQNTLSFASRAKKIKNKPILNELLSDSALIKRYLKQIAKLNQELEVIKQKSGMIEVEEISNKLKEKEEINRVLNERINRLKEVLIVSSSSPARKKAKRMPRERRRHSWGGPHGADGRMSFTGRSVTLTTIAEQSPSANSPPQANSTRLDETMCPFEKFELELMRDRNRDWNETVEDTKDSLAEEPSNVTLTNTPISTSTVPRLDGTIYNSDKTVDLTMVDHRHVVMGNEGTPPFVLRQRINSMTTIVDDVVKEYEELREFTTLEKQFHTEEINNMFDGMKRENSSLKDKLETVESELKSSEEKRLLSETKLEAAEEKILLMETEVESYKTTILELEDKIVKNSDENLVKEIAELEKVNSEIDNELKLKTEGFEKLREQCEEINSNFLKVSAEKDKLQVEIRGLMTKVKEMETINSDLEVTLEHKNRKSIERETELENELKAAWKALENRGKISTNDLIERECKQLEKISIVHDESNSPDPISEVDETIIADSNITDSNVTLESEKINFVSCDATFNNVSYLSPAESDPLKSFCLNESLIPIEIHDDQQDTSVCDTSVVENKMLIEDLCEILGEKDGLKEKIILMKAEASAIQKEYEDKRNSLISMTEELASYENMIYKIKESLNLPTDEEHYSDIDKEIANLKKSKSDMEENFKSEIEKLQVELDKRREFEQLFDTLNQILSSTVSPSDDLSHLVEKISDLVQFQATYSCSKNKFIANLIPILSDEEALEMSEEEIIFRTQKLRLENNELKNEMEVLNNSLLNIQQQWEHESAEFKTRTEDLQTHKVVLEDLCSLLNRSSNSENSVSIMNLNESVLQHLNQLENMSAKLNEFCDVVRNSYTLLEQDYNEDLSIENMKFAVIKFSEQFLALKCQIEMHENDRKTIDELKMKIENMSSELEEKTDYGKLSLEIIGSIQGYFDETCICTKDNLLECIEIMKLTISDLKNNIKEYESKSLKYNELATFINTCSTVVKGDCGDLCSSSDKIEEEMELLLDCIRTLKGLESQMKMKNEECLSLMNYKNVLENIIQALSDGNDTVSVGNILDEVIKYKKEFLEMEEKLEKLNEYPERISDMERQMKETESQKEHFAELFEKIKAIFEYNEDALALNAIPETIIQLKNENNRLFDANAELESFFNSCYSVLKNECVDTNDSSVSVEEKVGFVFGTINSLRGMEMDVEMKMEEFESLTKYKDVMENIFHVLSRGNDSIFTIENILDEIIKYKNDFVAMEEKLENLDKHRERISEMESQIKEIESNNKLLTGVIAKIQAELKDIIADDLVLDAIPEVIIKLKNQANATQKLEIFIQNCSSLLKSYGDDSYSPSDNIEEEMESLLGNIRTLKGNELEVVRKNEEFLSSVKCKNVLDKICEVLSNGNDTLFSVENVLNEIIKYKSEFLDMEEKLEKLNEYHERNSELENQVKETESKNKVFVEIVEKIQSELKNDFADDLTVDAIPEIVIKMKTEFKDLNEFKHEINKAIQSICADQAHTTDEVVSIITDMKKENTLLNDKAETMMSEYERKIELLNESGMKLKEYYTTSIDQISSLIGLETGCEIQYKIDEIMKDQRESPELSKLIEKIVEFNEAYSKMKCLLEEAVNEKNIYENVFRNIQSLLGDNFPSYLNTNMIEEAIADLKNHVNELGVHKNLVNEITKCLSSEHDCIPSEEIVALIADLKNKNSYLAERQELLETQHSQMSKTINDWEIRIERLEPMEAIIPYVCSMLKIDRIDQIQYGFQTIEDESANLRNKLDKVEELKNNYFETIRSVYLKLEDSCNREGDSDITSDEKLLVENLIRKAEEMKEEISFLKVQVDEMKSLLAEILPTDLCDNDFKSEDIKEAIDEIGKIINEVSDLRNENAKKRTEVETMKEQLNTHFECVDIVFNLCRILSDNIGKNIAKCDVHDTIQALLQRDSQLDENLVPDPKLSENVEIDEKDSEIISLKKEVEEFNAFTVNLFKILDIEEESNKDNLVQSISDLKNNAALVLKQNSDLQSDCVNYMETITKVFEAISESNSDDTNFHDKKKMLVERVRAVKEELVDIKNNYNKTLLLNQLLADFEKSVANVLGVTDSTPDTTLKALEILKSDSENNQREFGELKIQLESVTSEKLDLQTKMNNIMSVIKQNCTNVHNGEENTAEKEFEIYRSELLKMFEDYNGYVKLYEDLIASLADSVTDLTKSTVCETVATVKEENNKLKDALQEMSINNEKIVSGLTSAHENLISKLNLAEENEELLNKLKDLLSDENTSSEIDIIQSVAHLNDENSKMNAHLQELISENSEMKNTISQNSDLRSELNKCQSLLHEIHVHLDISHESNELLDNIQKLKSSSKTIDQLKDELLTIKTLNEELTNSSECLKSELHENIEKQAKNEAVLKNENDALNMQLLESKTLIEQLKQDSDLLEKQVMDSNNSVACKEKIIIEMEIECIKLKTDIDSHEKLVENLKNEMEAQENLIDELKNDMKLLAANPKTSEVDNSDENEAKLKETLEEMNNMQHKLERFVSTDKNLKKKLTNEIMNMKSNLKLESDQEMTVVQLLDLFVSVVIEKNTEVVLTLQKNVEADTNKLTEKLKQLEEKEKRLKEWIEQLENDMDNANQVVTSKSNEIESLLEIAKKKDFELSSMSEDLESVRQKLKNCEDELTTLRSKSNELENEMEKQLSLQNDFKSNSLELRENLEKIAEERDALFKDLNMKKDKISSLETDIESKVMELKTCTNKLKEKQINLEENEFIIANLKEKNEAYVCEIDTLKVALDEEKTECNNLQISLNALKEEYKTVQESLETNKKATDDLETKFAEILKDLNDTKEMTSSLIGMLHNEEKKEQAERKSLEKMNEEKANLCSDLKTKLYLLEIEHINNTSTFEQKISKLKIEVDERNRINQELRDVILENEKTISDKQNNCRRLEIEIDNLEKNLAEQTKSFSVLQNTIISKDLELEKVKQEVASLQEAYTHLKDKDKLNDELSYKNTLLEKDLLERSNQIKKLQDTLLKNEKDLQDMKFISKDLADFDQITIQLKDKEELCLKLSKTISSLEKEVADSDKNITKLKSDIICKDEDLSKLKKEVDRLSAFEENNKPDRHQFKKLKMKDTSLMNKFDDFEEKENGLCLKLNTSNNSQMIANCQKCRKFEKELCSLFKIPLKMEENVMEKVKQSVQKVEELETKVSELEDDNKQLDSECEAMNLQIKSLESECTNLLYKSDELTESYNKAKEEHDKELSVSSSLRKKNDNLTKDLNVCRIELEKCKEMVKNLRRDKGLQNSFRESERKQMDTSSSEPPSTPNPDFKSIKHRWEQLSTSSQKHQPTQNKDCQCEELLKQNQELKLELADKNNKVTLLEIQIQGQNFPYKKKAASLEEALNEAKTKIMTLKQEVRRLQTCLHDVSVFQSCDSCRNKGKNSMVDMAVQTTITDTEGSVSGSGVIQRQSMNILKERSTKLERENMLLKRLCRERNRKIEQLEHDLKEIKEPK